MIGMLIIFVIREKSVCHVSSRPFNLLGKLSQTHGHLTTSTHLAIEDEGPVVRPGEPSCRPDAVTVVLVHLRQYSSKAASTERGQQTMPCRVMSCHAGFVRVMAGRPCGRRLCWAPWRRNKHSGGRLRARGMSSKGDNKTYNNKGAPKRGLRKKSSTPLHEHPGNTQK